MAKQKFKIKRNLGKKIIASIFYLMGISFICVGSVCYMSFENDTQKSVKGANVDLDKSVSTKELVTTFQQLNKRALKPVMYNSFETAVLNSKYYPTSFVGRLVHYGPDCPECSGRLGCNGQDARNGNIYYNDSEYGKVRIVAMSSTIPCGSMIKINVNAYDKDGMYAIVMDRGVSGPMVDLLKPSASSPAPVRSVDSVVFDIVRYGY